MKPTFIQPRPDARQQHRILQIGDASGIQSPLSFGGFGALMRHARRLVGALDDALTSDMLTK